MSAGTNGTALGSRPPSSRLKEGLRKVANYLKRGRPQFKNPRFWLVQGLIIAIVVIHDFLERKGYTSHVDILYFLPISLFFIPVAYAVLNFGFAGSIATALWATALTVPNWVIWDNGFERSGEIFEMLTLFAVAGFIGYRVDRERDTRQQAEAIGIALKSSEMKYRRLFESSPIPILILALNGVILDANPAAGVLFGKSPETLKSMPVSEIIGIANEQKLLAPLEIGKSEEAYLVLGKVDGSRIYLEPEYSRMNDIHGNLVLQVLLRDVTEVRERQAGLRAYAAYVLRVQEEERQRISRELHDETIQTLSLLVRQLDSMKNTTEPLPSSAIEELREARRIAEEVVKGLREFARRLRPPILDDLGLVASIRRLVLDFMERTGVEGKLELVGQERRLPPDAELGMYRIAQEALWNVEQHSKATELFLTMTFREREARLDIRDNGVGFDVPHLHTGFPASDQLGLIGMQERAELLGGKLEIRSSLGKGTTVSASIPIASETS